MTMIDYKAVQLKYTQVHNDCLERTMLAFIETNIAIADYIKNYDTKNGFAGAHAEAKIVYSDSGKKYELKMGGMRLPDLEAKFNATLDELQTLGVRYTAVFQDDKFHVREISIAIYNSTPSEVEIRNAADQLSKGAPIEVSR